MNGFNEVSMDMIFSRSAKRDKVAARASMGCSPVQLRIKSSAKNEVFLRHIGRVTCQYKVKTGLKTLPWDQFCFQCERREKDTVGSSTLIVRVELKKTTTLQT